MTCLVAGVQTSAQGVCLPKRIISNNSCARDEQGDNPGQDKREFDGVLYKL